MVKDENGVQDVLRRQKVFTLNQVRLRLRCSSRTAQRRLTQWHTHTSYNHNGRYYALPGVPRFDSFGIWKHDGVFFSRFGNLTRTVVGVVDSSSCGLTVADLCALLGLPAHSLRTFFSKVDGIYRRKQGKRLIYLSSDDSARQRQFARRDTDPGRLPAESAAVLVLVDRIKYPHSSLDECARRVARKVPGLTGTMVRDLLLFHGILKKTANSNL